MLTKERVRDTIERLPDRFTIDEIIEELIVIDKIEQGLRDVEEGNVHTNEEVRQKLGKVLFAN